MLHTGDLPRVLAYRKQTTLMFQYVLPTVSSTCTCRGDNIEHKNTTTASKISSNENSTHL